MKKNKLLFILSPAAGNASCSLKISTCTDGKGGCMFTIQVANVYREKNVLAAWILSPNPSLDAGEDLRSPQTSVRENS